MPYRPRSTVTRQLTGDEEALEQRASPFLRNTTPQPDSFSSGQNRYAWMKRDLEMRDMQTRSLQNESQLAGELGDKRAYAEENTKEKEDDIMAQKGLDRMAEKVAAGMDPKQARFETDKELGLGLNEGFHSRAAARENIYETPDSRDTRIRKEKLDKLNLGKDEFNAEVARQVMEEDGSVADAVAIQRAKNKAAKIGAENSLTAAQIEDLDNDRRYEKAKTTSDNWKTYGDGTALGRARMTSALGKAGLGGIADKEKFIKDFSGEENDFVLQAIADEDFIKERFSDDVDGTPDRKTGKEKLANFAKTINDFQAKEPDAEKDPIAHDAWAGKRQRAEQLLYEFAGDHANQKQEAIDKSAKRKLAADTNKALENSNKEMSGIFKDSAKQAMDALSLKESANTPADNATKTDAVAAAGRSFLARARAMTPAGNDDLFDDFGKQLDEMVDRKFLGKNGSYLENPSMAVNKVHSLMADFLKAQKDRSVSGETQAPPPDTTVKKVETAEGGTVTKVETPVTPVPIPEDKKAAALEWLKQNPDHANAPSVRARLGIKP